jgi:hypothetical protein
MTAAARVHFVPRQMGETVWSIRVRDRLKASQSPESFMQLAPLNQNLVALLQLANERVVRRILSPIGSMQLCRFRKRRAHAFRQRS